MKIGWIRTACRCTSAALVMSCAAAPAGAQTDPGFLPDRPAVGLGAGFTNNGDENSGDRTTLDLSGHLDVPLATTWRLRAEVGTPLGFSQPGINRRVSADRVPPAIHSIVPSGTSRLGIDALSRRSYHYGLRRLPRFDLPACTMAASVRLRLRTVAPSRRRTAMHGWAARRRTRLVAHTFVGVGR